MELPPICLAFTKKQKFWPNPQNLRHMAVGYRVGPYPVTKGNVEFQAIRVSFVYRANPGYKILGQTVGFHANDTESLVFLYENDKLEWIFLSAHGSKEGNWCRPEHMLVDRITGAYIAFVSPTSHAMYTRPGLHLRLFGLANDETADHIRVLVTNIIPVDPNSLPRLPNLNQDKEFVPPEKTLNKAERFFGTSSIQKAWSRVGL